jgi:CBS domain-containing protein
MDTSAIRYRVADFLKMYPPFGSMEQADLLDLAQTGRVKFFEPQQYIVMQRSSRQQIFVIQQGTVLLWDEHGGEAKLLDVRGAGDILGIDTSGDGRSYPYAARSASDVLVYSFPYADFDALIQKYPDAKDYVVAYDNVRTHDGPSSHKSEPQDVFLHQLLSGKKLQYCEAQTSIRDGARQMLTTGAEAIVLLDSGQRACGTLTVRSFMQWIANGAKDPDKPCGEYFTVPPAAIAPDASVADGVLTASEAEAGVLAITSDGTTRGKVQIVVTPENLGQFFGDRPLDILREISFASDTQTLRRLNQRARSLVLRYLTSGAASTWLGRFTFAVDAKIMKRVIAMVGADEIEACWCFCGSSGRAETLTKLAPQVAMLVRDDQEASRWQSASQGVLDLLNQCGYLPNADRPFESLFYAASISEWKQRYLDWVSDPIRKEIYRAHPLFDLRPVAGTESLWQELGESVASAINRDFLHVMANDCLATLPPLTFFQNAVVDEAGEETSTFRLEESALRPLVDVARVFGMAARKVFGTSTLERFAMARDLVPTHSAIFEEASETLGVVLWQQGRAGINQDTVGSEVAPAQLGPYERQMLRNGFRAILRLLEFTGEMQWLKSLR